MDMTATAQMQNDLPLLVRCAQQGDELAFERLGQHFRPRLIALARVRVRDIDEAEDLVQDALVTAWQQITTLRDNTVFGAWLQVIVINACRRWQQRHVQWPTSLDALEHMDLLADPAPQPLEQCLERECWRRRRQALYLLPEQQRIPLLLYALGHCSYEDIALQLQLPVTTVEGRIARARKQLRRLLADDSELCDEKIKREPA